MTAEAAIRALLAEIDRYLARFDHPGVAEVRRGVAAAIGPFRILVPRLMPACRHLDVALAEMDERSLADAIAAATPFLAWGAYDAYPPAEIGAAFAECHGFASLIGEGSYFDAADFDLGLFLIGPDIFYRDHHHAAPELYAPLTGPHGWRFAPDTALSWKPAHAPVWNEPWAPHATLTGETPFLCLYAWTGNVNEPARVVPASDWPQLENRR